MVDFFTSTLQGWSIAGRPSAQQRYRYKVLQADPLERHQ